jgi:hypothetical protein
VVFVGRHGAMNPAGRARCNMRAKYSLATNIATQPPALFAKIVLAMTGRPAGSWQVPARRVHPAGRGAYRDMAVAWGQKKIPGLLEGRGLR